MSRVFRRDGTWWIDFRDVQGIRHRKKIGPNRRVAQEVLNDALGKIARRQHLGVIDDSAINFVDFARIWWERVASLLKPRTQERWRGILDQHLKPAFPGALRAIARAQIESYVSRRIENRAAASTINREITVLKHMLARAVRWEYLSNNQITGLKPLREPSGRTRFLSLEEIERLLAVCEESSSRYLHSFVVVALNTGMRRNEILGLTQRSIDWPNRVATLNDTKNGEARHVYLNDAALEALGRLLPPSDRDRLFPLGPNQTSMMFRRAVKRAGLEDFRLHDLRHTFASYQAMSGIAGRGLQSLLGHKDPRMTMRYSHLSEAFLRAAVNGVQLGRRAGQTSPEVGTYVAPSIESNKIKPAK
ncbi:MAG: tyrosine-type recombinase/integrase [Candidatus Binataceae bacterium]